MWKKIQCYKLILQSSKALYEIMGRITEIQIQKQTNKKKSDMLHFLKTLNFIHSRRVSLGKWLFLFNQQQKVGNIAQIKSVLWHDIYPVMFDPLHHSFPSCKLQKYKIFSLGLASQLILGNCYQNFFDFPLTFLLDLVKKIK